MDSQQNIRNFAIISHIDHGKSTLADRFLEITQTVEKNKMKEQMLDSMDLEREKGITIKLQPVRMKYNKFILNLIDTPGHVDFTYEVSRSLSAVEGAVLLVDATKGIQAQTIFNLDLALKENLKIIPAVNKIDLPNARADEVAKEVADLLAEDISTIEKISAKTGQGVEKILERIAREIPSPQGRIESPLRALVFDSFFDSYKGIIVYLRVVDGFLEKGDNIFFIASGIQGEVLDLGIFTPEMKSKDRLAAGEIGWVATGLKEIEKCRVGDTIAKVKSQKSKVKSSIQNPKSKNINSPLERGQGCVINSPFKKDYSAFDTEKIREISSSSEKLEIKPLPGYQEPEPMIYASFYLASEGNFNILASALEKLKLNDAALTYQGESSGALGQGFRVGLLGLLHLEIVSERLRREYGLDLIITSPSVAYKIIFKNGQEKFIYSPSEFPSRAEISAVEEPKVELDIICPKIYLGKVMELLKKYDGVWQDTQYLNPERVIFKYQAPLSAIIVDFYDQLKSVSSGFASMSYKPIGFSVSDLAKLDIFVAGQKIEAFSKIVPRNRAEQEGRAILFKLKETLPRQNFAMALQAVLEGKIIAREDVRAYRKDVIEGLYGGDYTRKRKLLEKQKKGKKRMKKFGRVNIPPEAFLAVLKNK
jgi:GTP-binding protein LepA